MNGLQASNEISKLSREIEAIERILMRVESDRDLNYESRVLKGIQKELKDNKSELESKLSSIDI